MAQQPTGTYRVRRPFIAGDQTLTPGDVVVVDEWRNAYQLIDRGYLVAAPDEQPKAQSVSPAPAKKARPRKAAAPPKE